MRLNITMRVLCSHVALLLVAVFFGIYNIIGKEALEHVPPLAFGLLRDAIAFPVLLLAGTGLEGGWMPATWMQFRALAVVGLVGVCLGQLLFLTALSLLPALVVALYQCLCPIATLIAAVLLGQERCTVQKCVGVFLATGGVAAIELLTNPSTSSTTSTSLWGHLAVIGQVVVVSTCWFTMMKPLHSLCGPVMLTTWLYGIGSLGLLAVSIAFGGMYPSSVLRWFAGFEDPKMIAILFYTALVCTCLNYSLTVMANKHVGATICSLYNTAQPITTALLGFALFRTPLQLIHAVGGLSVLLGLALCGTSTDVIDGKENRGPQPTSCLEQDDEVGTSDGEEEPIPGYT